MEQKRKIKSGELNNEVHQYEQGEIEALKRAELLDFNPDLHTVESRRARKRRLSRGKYKKNGKSFKR